MFSAVHAGGEQGWKSDHLEPFSLVGQMIAFPRLSARACLRCWSKPPLLRYLRVITHVALHEMRKRLLQCHPRPLRPAQTLPFNLPDW